MVNSSTYCFLDGTYSILTAPLFTKFLKSGEKYLCLVLEDDEGFLARKMVDLFSHKIRGEVVSLMPNSVTKLQNHLTSDTIPDKALYLDSQLDFATTFCFFADQATRFSPNQILNRKTEILSSRFVPQFGSQ